MLSIKKGCHVKSKYICYFTITVCKTIQNLVDFQVQGQTFLKRISLRCTFSTYCSGGATNQLPAYCNSQETNHPSPGISFFNLFQCGGCGCGVVGGGGCWLEGGRVGVGGGNPPATHQSFQSSGNLEEIISFR